MRAGPAAGASLSRRYRLAEGARASGSVAQEDSTGGQARLGGGRVAGRIVATVDLGDDMCIRRRRSRGCRRKERGSTGDRRWSGIAGEQNDGECLEGPI